MKVFITGSSGMLARMLIRYLIDQDIDIAGLDIKESDEFIAEKRFRFYCCDITESHKLKSIIEEEKPTVVIHFASSFNRVREREKEIEIDIKGSDNVLEACNHTTSVKQLIYSSSAAVYGGKKGNPLWLKESQPLIPEYYRYGMNKKQVERNYTDAIIRNDIKIVILRICTVVGPIYDKPRSVVSILLKLRYMPSFTRETKIQFIHTEDMVALFGMIMNDREISGVFNFAGETYSVVKDIARNKSYIPLPVFIIKAVLTVLWNLRIVNLQPAGIGNSFYPLILDPAKLVSRYNYKFRYTSDEAFIDVAARNRLPEGTRF